MTLPQKNPCPREGINGRQSNGLGEFLLLAAALAVCGIVLAVTLAIAAGWLAPLIPFRWEQAIAGSALSQHSSAHPQAQKELQQLTQRLASNAHLPAQMTLHINIENTTTANAFATLGGRIFVTRGLLRHVASENALAFVLAHEIGHIKHRDPLRSLGSGATFELIWAGLTGANGQSAATRILGHAGLLTRLTFSRDMEARADRFALRVLRRTYGSDCGAGELFRAIFKHRDQPTWSVFMRSHPLTRDRLALIRKATASHPPAPLKPLPPALAKLSNAPQKELHGCTHNSAESRR